jgi:hypothetical protein
MFPERFVEGWVEQLSRPGDLVLDPFAGRGTTPFQALLMGRRAVASDTNPVAYCLTRAKTLAPSLTVVRARISRLEGEYRSRASPVGEAPSEFFELAFSKPTLDQLLFLRGRLAWRRSPVDAMLGGLVLGSLHGELSSPRYLSNQMARTISTKPAYSIRFWKERGLLPPERDVFDLLRMQAEYRYESCPPQDRAVVYNEDVRGLPRVMGGQKARLVVTSPPYLDVTSFEEDQWLRLWFLGGPSEPRRNWISRDDRHRTAETYWRFISDMWRSLGRVLDKRADVVIRIGASKMTPERLVEQLHVTSLFAGRPVKLLSTEVSSIARRQTDAFRPGTQGCRYEVDCHLRMV